MPYAKPDARFLVKDLNISFRMQRETYIGDRDIYTQRAENNIGETIGKEEANDYSVFVLLVLRSAPPPSLCDDCRGSRTRGREDLHEAVPQLLVALWNNRKTLRERDREATERDREQRDIRETKRGTETRE